MITGGITNPAKREDPSSAPIFSACRPAAELAAFGGPLPAAQAGMNKRVEFVRTAMIHLSQGNYERAIEQFGSAIGLNPSNPNFHIGRGIARMSHANSITRSRILIRPSHSSLIPLSRSSAARRFTSEAAQGCCADRVLSIELSELYPRNAAALVIRGDAYVHMKEYYRGIKDIDEAIRPISALLGRFPLPCHRLHPKARGRPCDLVLQ